MCTREKTTRKKTSQKRKSARIEQNSKIAVTRDGTLMSARLAKTPFARFSSLSPSQMWLVVTINNQRAPTAAAGNIATVQIASRKNRLDNLYNQQTF